MSGEEVLHPQYNVERNSLSHHRQPVTRGLYKQQDNPGFLPTYAEMC